MKTYVCISGMDFIRGDKWTPIKKTLKGWGVYAKQQAKKSSYGKYKPSGFLFIRNEDTVVLNIGL